ncbi:hypothetical protein PYCC9005_005696 [Savitreella phatthalungensis]
MTNYASSTIASVSRVDVNLSDRPTCGHKTTKRSQFCSSDTSSIQLTMSSMTVKPSLPFPIVQEMATKTGYNIFWVVFVLMLLATASYVVLALRVQKELRLFHYITSFITLTAAMSYYAMATHAGTTFTSVGHDHYRQIFYARYIDWTITTPLLLLDLALLAGLSGIDLIALVFADLGMIVTGLFASLEANRKYSWGWYAIACIFFLYIIYILVISGRVSANTRGQKVAKLYDSVAFFTIILWTLYPIAWGVSEGAAILSVDQEIGFYAVLDVLAKGVFGLWLLTGHQNIPEAAVPLQGWWINGVNSGSQNADLA